MGLEKNISDDIPGSAGQNLFSVLEDEHQVKGQ